MTLKKYHQFRLAVTVVVAMLFSQTLILGNFFLPVITVILAWILLTYLRCQVKEVIADERDYQIGGQSAFRAIQIYSWISLLILFTLYAFRHLNPYYETIAFTLAYSTCSLMLLYSLIFKFHDRFILSKRRALYYFIISLLIALFTVFSLRFFSGEDTWLCQQGTWVQHGHPSFPAPKIPCH